MEVTQEERELLIYFMKNRYIFFKRLFPDSIILFKTKNKYETYKNEKSLMKYIKFKTIYNLKKLKINYIIIDDLNIKYKKTYKNNNYYKYYYQEKINKIFLFIIKSE